MSIFDEIAKERKQGATAVAEPPQGNIFEQIAAERQQPQISPEAEPEPAQPEGYGKAWEGVDFEAMAKAARMERYGRKAEKMRTGAPLPTTGQFAPAPISPEARKFAEEFRPKLPEDRERPAGAPESEVFTPEEQWEMARKGEIGAVEWGKRFVTAEKLFWGVGALASLADSMALRRAHDFLKKNAAKIESGDERVKYLKEVAMDAWRRKIPPEGRVSFKNISGEDVTMNRKDFQRYYQSELREWDKFDKDVDFQVKLLVDAQKAKEEIDLRGPSLGASITEGVIDSASYMADFALSGGFASLGKGTVARTGKWLLKKEVQWGVGKVGRAVTRAGIRFAGGVAGGITRTMSPFFLARVAAQAEELNLPQSWEIDDAGNFVVTKEGMPRMQAYLASFTEVAVANISETAGRDILRVGGAILNRTPVVGRVNRAFGKYLRGRFKTTAGVRRGLEAIGISNLFGEWVEEDYEGFWRAVLNPRGSEEKFLKRWANEFPDAREAVVRLAVLGIPTGAAAALKYVAAETPEAPEARPAPPTPPQPPAVTEAAPKRPTQPPEVSALARAVSRALT